jgi:transposase InsO family protein
MEKASPRMGTNTSSVGSGSSCMMVRSASAAGSRRLTALLRAEGQAVNRKRVRRLMREMGIAALGPKPRTTKPAPGHKIFPYLLRGLSIDRPNHVWSADITYIPIGRGHLYLVAIMDWASRAVLAWRLSNSMDVSFCVAALEEDGGLLGGIDPICEPAKAIVERLPEGNAAGD